MLTKDWMEMNFEDLPRKNIEGFRANNGPEIVVKEMLRIIFKTMEFRKL